MKVIFKTNVEASGQIIPIGTKAVVVKVKVNTDEEIVEMRNVETDGVINIPIMTFKVFTEEIAT